jgi:hypothetical protein
MGYRGDFAAFIIEQAKHPAAPRKHLKKHLSCQDFCGLCN